MIADKFKTPWLQYLRHPNARQACGALNRPSGKCCLGVLADVIVEEKLIPNAHWVPGSDYTAFSIRPPHTGLDMEGDEYSTTSIPDLAQTMITGWEYDGGGSLPCTWIDLYEMFPDKFNEFWFGDDPISVMIDQYGVERTNHIINGSVGRPSLIVLNDEVGLSFAQIADVVEKYL